MHTGENTAEHQYPDLKECKEVITIEGQPSLCKIHETGNNLADTGYALGIVIAVAIVLVGIGYMLRKIAS